RGEAGGQARLVAGIGLNVAMAPQQVAAINQPWQRLADHVSALPSRNALAATMLDTVLQALAQFQRDGFAPFRARWPQLDLVHGRAVSIDDGSRKRRGVACGIGDDGALRVAFDASSVESVYAGEVSLRMDS